MRFCDYPDNLIREIFCEEDLSKRPADFDGTLAYILAGLPPNQQEIVQLRFVECITLEEAGKRTGTTRERARQLEAKALAKLRNPIWKRYLRKGIRGVIEQEAEVARRQATKAAAASLADSIEKRNAEITVQQAAALVTDIDEMGLSVRAHNCMKKIGCRTAYDIMHLTPEVFWKTRNLGHKTGIEIISKLEALKFNCGKFRENERKYISSAK